MLTTITNEQKVLVSVAATTEAGNATTLHETPQWEVVTGDVTVEPSEDGLSAFVVSGETETDAVVSVKAKINDQLELTNTFEISVVAAQAATLSFTSGEPELK